jgi:hypothetical protein
VRYSWSTLCRSLAVVGAVAAWKRPASTSNLPPEHVMSAIRTGMRNVANTTEFRVVLRAAGHVLPFSALPALLAVFTRARLNGSAAEFGLLLGALGIGGVAGAVVLPLARACWRTDRIVIIAILTYAAVLASLANLCSLSGAG